MVFADHAGSYTAKVADFGYSILSANQCDEEQIYLPKSKPWNAPEVDDQDATFSLTQAKMTDLYSFGILCLWLLFKDTPLMNSTCLGPIPEEKGYHKFFCIRKLREDGELLVFVRARIDEITSLNKDQKSGLVSFFSLTLSDDPSSRILDLKKIMEPFTPHQYVQHPIRVLKH